MLPPHFRLANQASQPGVIRVFQLFQALSYYDPIVPAKRTNICHCAQRCQSQRRAGTTATQLPTDRLNQLERDARASEAGRRAVIIPQMRINESDDIRELIPNHMVISDDHVQTKIGCVFE